MLLSVCSCIVTVAAPPYRYESYLVPFCCNSYPTVQVWHASVTVVFNYLLHNTFENAVFTVYLQWMSHHTGVKVVFYCMYYCRVCPTNQAWKLWFSVLTTQVWKIWFTVLSQCLSPHAGLKLVVYCVVAVAGPPAENGHGDAEELPRNPCSHASAHGAALCPEGKSYSQWSSTESFCESLDYFVNYLIILWFSETICEVLDHFMISWSWLLFGVGYFWVAVEEFALTHRPVAGITIMTK